MSWDDYKKEQVMVSMVKTQAKIALEERASKHGNHGAVGVVQEKIGEFKTTGTLPMGTTHWRKDRFGRSVFKCTGAGKFDVVSAKGNNLEFKTVCGQLQGDQESLTFHTQEEANDYLAQGKPLLKTGLDFFVWFAKDDISYQQMVALDLSLAWVMTAENAEKILHIPGMVRVQQACKKRNRVWTINIQGSTLERWLINNYRNLPWTVL